MFPSKLPQKDTDEAFHMPSSYKAASKFFQLNEILLIFLDMAFIQYLQGGIETKI